MPRDVAALQLQDRPLVPGMAQVVRGTEHGDERRVRPLVSIDFHLMRAHDKPQPVPPQKGVGHIGPEDVAAVLHAVGGPVARLAAWIGPEQVHDQALNLRLLDGKPLQSPEITCRLEVPREGGDLLQGQLSVARRQRHVVGVVTQQRKMLPPALSAPRAPGLIDLLDGVVARAAAAGIVEGEPGVRPRQTAVHNENLGVHHVRQGQPTEGL
mmetsp:Transcript_99489/g.252752  ORF Transcript_99489/g.252752 Transcript_99489/m.252752 type:complete len:211 (+) Transcript_99489:146-778(+)